MIDALIAANALGACVALVLTVRLARHRRGRADVARAALWAILAAAWLGIGVARAFVIYAEPPCDSRPRVHVDADGTVSMYVPCIPPGGSVEVPVDVPAPVDPKSEI